MGGNLKPIRRCRECGYKTHRKLWTEDKCPVCDVGSTYVESTHGGLTERQIEIARASLNKAIRNIEQGGPLTKLHKERHY